MGLGFHPRRVRARAAVGASGGAGDEVVVGHAELAQHRVELGVDVGLSKVRVKG